MALKERLNTTIEKQLQPFSDSSVSLIFVRESLMLAIHTIDEFLIGLHIAKLIEQKLHAINHVHR